MIVGKTQSRFSRRAPSSPQQPSHGPSKPQKRHRLTPGLTAQPPTLSQITRLAQTLSEANEVKLEPDLALTSDLLAALDQIKPETSKSTGALIDYLKGIRFLERDTWAKVLDLVRSRGVTGLPSLESSLKLPINGKTTTWHKRRNELAKELHEKDFGSAQLAQVIQELRASALVPWNLRAFRDIETQLTTIKSGLDHMVTINMPLVHSMAKRYCVGINFDDAISEGSMALHRAVKKFDPFRGFLLSTYACRAIIKGFARVGDNEKKHRSHYRSNSPVAMEEHRGNVSADDAATHKLLNTEDLAKMNRCLATDYLNPTEKLVIQLRFGLRRTGPMTWKTVEVPEEQKRKIQEKMAQKEPLILDEVGVILGVTKERVRQIQNSGLRKLRELLEDPHFDRGEQFRNLPLILA